MIKLIDPNDINVPTIDGKDFNGTNDLTNGLPPYEKMFIFAELRVSRRGNTEIIAGSDGLLSVGQTANDINISLMGYGEYTDSDGTVKKIYSTRYTDNVGGTTNKSYLEGIGIKNINMKINSSYVPQVTIEMVDTKGLSYVNVGGTQISPYSIIDSMPPPIYELTLKGYYGQAITYQLHYVNGSKTLDSNGNYNIKLELIGMHFAPLTDVLIQHAKIAPFMKFCEPYNNGEKMDINYDGKAPVKNFFELCMRSKMLTVKLAQYKNSTTDDEDLANAKLQIDQINQIIKNLAEFDGATNLHPYLVNVGLDGGLKFTIQKQLNVSGVITPNLYVLSIDRDSSSTGNTLTFKTAEPVLKIITNNIIKDAKNIQGITEKDLDLKHIYVAEINGRIYYGIQCESLLRKFEELKNTIKNNGYGLEQKIKQNINNITYDSLGFYPYIGNVFKIICQDVDKFYKTLKKAGKDAKKIYEEKPEVLSVFGVNNSNRKTSSSILHPFPDYFKTDKPIGSRPSAQTKGWLGQLAKDKKIQLAEVDYVDDFINSFLGIQSAQKEIDALIVNSTDSSGNSKFFPINPYDSSFYGLTVGEYTNSHNLYAILTTILKRFTIASQYTYSETFYDSSTGFGKIKSFFQKIVGSDASNNDKYFLAKSTARMEAVNLSNVFFNDKSLDECINFFKTVTTYDSFIAELDKLSAKTEASGLGTFYKTGTLVDYSDPNKIDGDFNKIPINGHDLYSNFNNDNFQRFDLKKKLPSQVIRTDGDEQKLVDDLLGNQKSILVNQPIEFSKDNLFYQKDVEFKNEPPTGNIYSDFFLNIENHKINAYEYYSNYRIVKSIIDRPEIKNTDGTINNDQAFYALININDGLVNSLVTSHLLVEDKFRLAGIIECPYVFVLTIGNILKLKKENEFKLSKKDSQLFLDEYDKFIKFFDFTGYFNAINAITNKDAQKDEKKVFEPFQTAFLTPDLTGDGLSFMEQIIIVNNSNINSDTKLSKYRTPIDVLKDGNLKEGNTVYFSTLLYELKTRLTKKLKDKKEEEKNTKNKLNDNDLKTDVYYMFKNIHDRWLTDTAYKKAYDDSFGYPNFSSVNSTTLFERFKFVDRAYNDISGTGQNAPGNGCVIDISSLGDFLENNDASVFTLISRLLADNGFNFFPLQSFIDYNNGNDWFNSFKISESVSPANNGPTFVCMYVGGNSSKGEDPQGQHKDDGFQIGEEPDDYSTGNVRAFRLSFGKQNQSIFKNIQTNTSEFRETHESLNILAKIAGDGSKSVQPAKGQSLFNIQEQRSYTCSATMLGNMMIQPTLYFQLDHLPIFRGAYMILDVEHTITPNYMETKFEGVRLLKFPVPFVTDYATEVGSIDGSSSDVSLSPSGSIVASNNNNGNVTQGVGSVKDTSNFAITNDFIKIIKNVKFKNSTDIVNYFKNLNATMNQTFPQFFNNGLAGKGSFGIVGRFQGIGGIIEPNFNKFWDNIPTVFNKPSINVLEFIALQTIISNETGARYVPITEGINGVSNNPSSNPGLSYTFNKISGLKQSYNISSANILVYDCFNDPNFISQHGNLKFGNILKNTKDTRWQGQIFPYDFSNTSISEEVTSIPNFITEADFFKFRGRGFIQTTFRIGYVKIIQYILNYDTVKNPNNKIIASYKKLWTSSPYNSNIQIIATRSSNADWDILFDSVNNTLPYDAVYLHSSSNGGYLNIPDTEIKPDNSNILKNYLKNYAVRIAGAGASDYHKLYVNRVFQTLGNLGNVGNLSI